MKKGFTFIELLFALIIIGILTSVILPKFLNVNKKAEEIILKSFEANLNRNTSPIIFGILLSRNQSSLSELKDNEKMLNNYIKIPYLLLSNNSHITKIGADKADLKLSIDNNLNKIILKSPSCKDSKGWIIMVGKDNNNNIKEIETKINKNLFEYAICDNNENNPLNFILIYSKDNGNTWTYYK